MLNIKEYRNFTNLMKSEHKEEQIKCIILLVPAIFFGTILIFILSYSISFYNSGTIVEDWDTNKKITDSLLINSSIIDIQKVDETAKNIDHVINSLEKQNADSIKQELIKELQLTKTTLKLNAVTINQNKLDKFRKDRDALTADFKKLSDDLPKNQNEVVKVKSSVDSVKNLITKDSAEANSLQEELKQFIEKLEISESELNNTITKIKEVTVKIGNIEKEINSLSTGKTLQNVEILRKQYLLDSNNVEQFMKLGRKHAALSDSLFFLIVIFTAAMSIIIFAISSKGWDGSNRVLKAAAITVAILLGVSNLVNSIMKPKENYITYFKKADISERSRYEILKTTLRIDELNQAKVDSIITNNFDRLGKISETLSTYNETEISTTDLMKNLSF